MEESGDEGVCSRSLRKRLRWPLIRAHVCTAAVALSLNATWRVPRDSFRYGALPYLLLHTVASLLVALPVALLHLATGQLSQQDAVGVWRAVPFFRGIGYIKLLTSFLSSIYTVIYVALSSSYFLYTLQHGIPFPECIVDVYVLDENGSEAYFNNISSAQCLNDTFLAPVKEKAQYYIALCMIITLIWIVFPFVLYYHVKSMRRIFYALGPLILVLGLILIGSVGEKANLGSFAKVEDWMNLVEPFIWQAALSQALVSSQLAGGYLITVGDTVYSSTNVLWTACVFTGTNSLASWAGVIFWHSISSDPRDSSLIAVLVQIYQTTEDKELCYVWAALLFAMMLLSGVVTLLTLLYPVYDRFRRAWDVRWREFCVRSSILGIAVSLPFLAGRQPAITLLDDVAVPFLVHVSISLEILAFVFVYGLAKLIEDIEYLTNQRIPKYLAFTWCAAPCILLPFTAWWYARVILDNFRDEQSWRPVTLFTTTGVAVIIFVGFSIAAVVQQVQFDLLSKIKASFKPSRHWGPRDPIAHYYWMHRKEEVIRMLPHSFTTPKKSFSEGRYLEMIAFRPFDLPLLRTGKKRALSDDWFWTGQRREFIRTLYKDIEANIRKRSKSLEWVPTLTTKPKENMRTVTFGGLDLHVYEDNTSRKEHYK